MWLAKSLKKGRSQVHFYQKFRKNGKIDVDDVGQPYK
jgi:hypothetical protein